MTELDAGWLTEALRRSLGTDASVTAVERTSIGTGQVGENVRLALTWSEEDPSLPSSVVAKLPSSSAISRATAVHLDTYVKEVGFYRDLQATVSIRTPRVHAIEWHPDTHDFVLLMEDIRPASQGDQLGGCDVARAQLAIDQAVGLHAPTWRADRGAGHLDWLAPVRADEDRELRTQMFELLTPGFVDRFRARLGSDVLELGTRLVASYPAWHNALVAWADANGAWCLVHGDYRLDNMLFGAPPASPALTIVDWQTVAIGIGPADIAYFLGAGLLPEVRSEHERGLVGRYAAGLQAHGVDVSDAAIWDGYVLGAATGYYMAVLASQVVEQTERGDEMFAVMAERHAAQVGHLGLLDRLGA